MPEPTMFGRRLKLLREARGWTQEELYSASGVPAAMISHFETGQRQNASADNLVKLSNAFHVTIDYLVGRSNEPQVASEAFSALYRGLEGASAETQMNAQAMLRALIEEDRKRKGQSGTEGTDSP